MKKILLLAAGLFLIAACSKQQNMQTTDTTVNSSSNSNSSSQYNSSAPAPAPNVTGTPVASDTPKTAPGQQVPAADTGVRTNP